MITFNEFKEVIENFLDFQEELNKYYDLKVDLYDTKLVSFGETMFDKYIRLIFNNDGVEWIYWWLFERPSVEPEEAWDENGNVIPTETIEDLYNLLQNYYN